MKRMPPPKWIFKNLLQQNSVVMFYGPSGIGKTFVALEMMFSIVCMHKGVFKPEANGPVVYVAAEGVYGLGSRVRAWEESRGVNLSNFGQALFMGEAVQLVNEKERHNFMKCVSEYLGDQRPTLVILDTLSKCAAGLEENSAKDMGLFAKGLDDISRTFDTTVMAIHHSTKSRPDTERGSGALYGAVDTVLMASQTNNSIQLTCRKQKNGEAALPIRMTLKRTGGSCVIAAATNDWDSSPFQLPDITGWEPEMICLKTAIR